MANMGCSLGYRHAVGQVAAITFALTETPRDVRALMQPASSSFATGSVPAGGAAVQGLSSVNHSDKKHLPVQVSR